MAARDVLSTGKTQDDVLAAAAREIHQIEATRDIRIRVTHAPGKTLILADALSRAPIDKIKYKLAMSIVNNRNMKFIIPIKLAYVFSPT